MDTDCRFTAIPYKNTGYFSDLVNDYLEGKPSLDELHTFRPDDAGLDKAIEARKQFPVNRALLVDALEEQYDGFVIHESVAENIAALADENTFTICTAHQPNLMTGYLYFVYKILHAVKLSRHLAQRHPELKFVPVFYIGSEDNDLDELGVFRYGGIKYRWQTEQTGAVGRMNTADLQPLIQQLFALIGPPGPNADVLKDIIYNAYQKHETIGAATRYLVNELLGHFGVVVIDPDDAELKKAFVPILKDELLNPVAHTLVQDTSAQLAETYKAQAFARPINLFYLFENTRERIEQTVDGWKVLKSDKKWDEASLTAEIEQHPERFSPNVILRGLFQETVLPNVAFIGGGSEVAYWLQLKPVFDHFKVFFPALVLRQSILWMDKNAVALQQKSGLNNEEMFQPLEIATRNFVQKHTHKDLELEASKQQFVQLFEQIKSKATAVDVTLRSSADAALTKMRYQLDVIEKKMMRAEKRNMGEALSKLYKLKAAAFPNNSLQERYETFMPYFLNMGYDYFDVLLDATLPYGNEFVLIKDESKLL